MFRIFDISAHWELFKSHAASFTNKEIIHSFEEGHNMETSHERYRQFQQTKFKIILKLFST